MNARQTKDFFAAVGWTLVRDLPDPFDPRRWALISPEIDGAISTLGFDSLRDVWRYWKGRLHAYLFQEDLVPYLVEQYLNGGDQRKQAIEMWLRGEGRSDGCSSILDADMCATIQEMDFKATASIVQWRGKLAMYCKNKESNHTSLYADFFDRLMEAECRLLSI